ncbi:MAG: tRNA (adenosine(37)-N6)-threonylcarbamoyltransferase complex dimerization subunit type 1 TsaB [Deltaproteobacteria bacterium]|nr:tRNA (adenosine(37)-N6)-threonylcarbamoyltransferase complex dimerization subunit type 1 TsaB [Deltaproteobacteria bacterium]
MNLKILALDTSTETGGVALLEGDVLRTQVQIRVAKTHASQLWATIFFLLEQTGWGLEDIDLWAVTVGPGSFTGLRIGLATIKRLAFATQKTVVGVSTLEALAFSFSYSPYLICALIDARQKEVFCGFFKSTPAGKVEKKGEPRHIKPLQLTEEIDEPVLLVGNGAMLYQDLLKEKLGPQAIFPSPHLHLISPFVIGLLAGSRFQPDYPSTLDEIRPLYIRPSDAELNRHACQGRGTIKYENRRVGSNPIFELTHKIQ